MINACLPVIQPALRRILRTEKSGRPSGHLGASSSTVKLNMNAKRSKFQKINDSFMLTDTGTTETYVGSSSQPESIGEDELPFQTSAIKVKRGWEITSGN